jgi:UDP-GlcNAc:undecaprenyl-phosphate GlcNAc-1-phosphate transferase
MARRPTRFQVPEVGWPGRLAAAGLASVATQATYRRLTAPGSLTSKRFERVNHRGSPITLAQGPATVVGSVIGIALTPELPGRLRGAGVVAASAAGAVGLYDDLFGAPSTKGLRGHLSALTHGEVTSGAVKIVGIGAAGLLTGAWARGGRGGVVDALLTGVVVSGSANLLNLFDLRPGRAAKVYLAASGPVLASRAAGGGLLAGPTGALVALLPGDLAERSMLGDAGANALGAAYGVAVAATMSRVALVTVSAAIVALTLISERVSYSELIEQNPALRAFDALGRRPAP